MTNCSLSVPARIRARAALIVLVCLGLVSQVAFAQATTTTVAASTGTITLGDTVMFTATVTTATGTPTGLVTFFDGATPLGSGTLQVVGGNNQATFSTSLLSAAASPHSITATYHGDATHNGSTSSPAISETVNPRTSTTGVVMSPATVVVGQASTATVTLTDSGSVPSGTPDVFAATGAPLTGRTGFISVLFGDGLVLVAGGTGADGTTVLQSAEVYSVSGGTFGGTGNLNAARTGAVAVLLPNGKVLVAGGSSDGTANGALSTAELFDPVAGTFAPTSQNMTAARFGTTATLLDTGKVLIAGGENSGGVLNNAELYDPAADTFTATGNLNVARTGASATLLGTGKVLVAGGSSDGTANGALNSAELFDPAGNAGAGTFTSVAGANPALATGRWQGEAALLLSGKVLIAGGQNSGGAVTSADLYDPVADSFTPSSQQMAQARANGSAVALPNGMVLLAGGTTSQAVDLYDAESDQFDTTGSLQQSDNGLVSTLLNNGQVLVVGLTTAATPASDAELYAPSFNPLGTAAVTSSEATDGITGACILTPSNSTDSTCTSTVTPANVATSPHTITGTYSADAVHSSSSGTASLTVNKADTMTAVTSSANPSVFGQVVTFTATVSPVAPGSGTPTGTVTFLDNGVIMGTATLSGGVATFTTSSLAVGNHPITTAYSGDANFNINNGALTGNPQVVNKADTTTAVFSSLNPSFLSQVVTFTATVSPVAPGAGTPTGTVTFFDGGSPMGTATLSGGLASFTTAGLALGNHTITTSYGGDGNFNSNNGSLTGNPQVVNKFNTTTTVLSSPNSSALGQVVTFTAIVSAVAPGTGAPTGTVTFLDGANPLGTATLSGGVASFSIVSLAAGDHKITTSYGGDASFSGSTGSLTGNPQVVVAPPLIAKGFNPGGISPNGVSTMTITITNPQANTVQANGVAFTDIFPANLVVATPNGLTNTCGGTPVATSGSGSVSLSGGSILVNSSCKVAVNVTAAFTGSYVNSTGPVSSTNGATGGLASAALFVANPPTISKLFLPVTVAQDVSTLLSFTISNPNSNSTLPNNDVTLTGITFTDALPAGLQVASPNNLSSDCGGTVTAVPGSTSITLSGGALAPAVGLVPGRRAASASRLSAPLASGSCFLSLLVTPTAAGTLDNITGSISANESGPGAASNTASLTVTPGPTIVAPTLTKTFIPADIAVGQSTALTFTVTNANLSTPLINAAFTDALPSGLVVSSPNGLGGTCVTNNGVTVVANPGSGSVNLVSLNLPANSSCSFSVNVTGVTFGAKNNVTGAISASFDTGSGTFLTVTGGTASASMSVEAPVMAITKTHTGTFSRGQTGAIYTITVSNTGMGNTVGPVTVTDTLPAVPNTVVPTAVSGTGWACDLPSLTCTRSDALLAGTSYPPITLTVNVPQNIANHFVNTAAVSGGGDANSHSATDGITLVGKPILITSTDSGSVTIAAGMQATFNFTVDATAINPPPGVIVITCGGLPKGAACIPSPLAEAQPFLSETVTITTLGRGNSGSALPFANQKPPMYLILLLGFLGLAGISFTGRRGRKQRLRLATALIGLMTILALWGCGGNPLVTPPGTYTITVTATEEGGAASGSTTVRLTVQ